MGSSQCFILESNNVTNNYKATGYIPVWPRSTTDSLRWTIKSRLQGDHQEAPTHTNRNQASTPNDMRWQFSNKRNKSFSLCQTTLILHRHMLYMYVTYLVAILFMSELRQIIRYNARLWAEEWWMFYSQSLIFCVGMMPPLWISRNEVEISVASGATVFHISSQREPKKRCPLLRMSRCVVPSMGSFNHLWISGR